MKATVQLAPIKPIVREVESFTFTLSKSEAIALASVLGRSSVVNVIEQATSLCQLGCGDKYQISEKDARAATSDIYFYISGILLGTKKP